MSTSGESFIAHTSKNQGRLSLWKRSAEGPGSSGPSERRQERQQKLTIPSPGGFKCCSERCCLGVWGEGWGANDPKACV